MNVLFVCTGNICRSPLAEGILRHKFRNLGIEGVIDSCGFEAFHTGDAPDDRAQAVAKSHGIDISGHRSRLFRVEDFDRFDRIYAMDSSHYTRIMHHARNDRDRARVDYITNLATPGKNLPVPDPWYDDRAAFEKVYQQLDPLCDRIAALQNRKTP